jgi:hypothetical protein
MTNQQADFLALFPNFMLVPPANRVAHGVSYRNRVSLQPDGTVRPEGHPHCHPDSVLIGEKSFTPPGAG